MERTSSVAEAAASPLPVFAIFFSALFSFSYRVTFLIGSSSSSPSMASLDRLLFFMAEMLRSLAEQTPHLPCQRPHPRRHLVSQGPCE